MTNINANEVRAFQVNGHFDVDQGESVGRSK